MSWRDNDNLCKATDFTYRIDRRNYRCLMDQLSATKTMGQADILPDMGISQMATSITTRMNYNRINTVHVQYPARLDVDPITSVESGEILPDTSGFPTRYEPPSVSFKTYRSVSNWGHKKIADYALQNRKRSFITPNYIWNGIMAFGGKCPPKTRLLSYEHAQNIIRAALKVDDKIPIMGVMDSIEHIPRSTSPGLPWIVNVPGLKKREILNRFLPSIVGYWRRVGAGLPVVPLPDCAAFARSHISTPDKNKEILPQMAYGMEMMKGGMTWLHFQAMRARYFDPGCKFIMLDYSAFDSLVPAWLIRDSFKLLAEKFDFSHVNQGGNILPVDESHEKRKFKRMVDYFINTTIRNSDGRRFRKNHGVPFGSMFTNIIDTIVNLLVMYTICDCSLECTPIFELAFGDEGLICIPSSVLADVECFSRVAKEIFGMVVSPTKSYATTNLKNIRFFGYYNNNGSPIKDSIDLIASMLYPQFLKDDWSYCISRALGCMLASAGSSSDVFLCGQAVWNYASRFPEVRGVELIRENPELRRYLDQMGCSDLSLSHDFFFDINLLIPAWNCRKIQRNIQLVRAPLMY